MSCDSSTNVDNEDDASGSDSDDDNVDSNFGYTSSDQATALKRLTSRNQKLTQVALQSVIEGVTSLFQCHLDALYSKFGGDISKLDRLSAQSFFPASVMLTKSRRIL